MSYPLPKISRVIANASASIKDSLLVGARTGRFKVDEATQKSRLSFCQDCDYYRPEDSRCSHPACGCYVRLKAWLYSQRCPAGKW